LTDFLENTFFTFLAHYYHPTYAVSVGIAVQSRLGQLPLRRENSALFSRTPAKVGEGWLIFQPLGVRSVSSVLASYLIKGFRPPRRVASTRLPLTGAGV
jgi:hypothetical protein